MASRPEEEIHKAGALASEAHLPRPTVSKILKGLAREGLLVSHRGVQGGYSLARKAEEISVADIIRALDGPIAMTDCITDESGNCDLQARCPTRLPWLRINQAVRGALESITLSDMAPRFDAAILLEWAKQTES